MSHTLTSEGYRIVEVCPQSREASLIYDHFTTQHDDDDHRLMENYRTLDLSRYETTFAVFNDDELVSFSCIQRYPQGQWRISSRLWTARRYRSTGMLPSSWNGKYLMPIQIKWLEAKGLTTPFVFWSREHPIKNLPWTLKKVNNLTETTHKHVMLPGYYNTGLRPRYTLDIKSCWQKIIYVSSEVFRDRCMLPHISEEEYAKRHAI